MIARDKFEPQHGPSDFNAEIIHEKIVRRLFPKIWQSNRTIGRTCLYLLEWVQSDRNFLKNVITGDKKLICEYDPETKRPSKEWHTSASKRPKKERMRKSKIKSMLICFLTVKGFSIQNFCLKDKLLISFITVRFLRLRKRVVRVRPSIPNNSMPHHNAPCHMAICVIEVLAKKGIPVFPQPHSPLI